jgi:hypothetical protein
LWGALWFFGDLWIYSWYFSGDGMRPAGWFGCKPNRAFAPRRLYDANELVAFLVMVNMSDIP